jgi:hypothetical protein
MSCEHYHEAISALVEGTLDSVERREIEDHLAVCRECAALARDLQQIREAASGLDALDPPAALWNRIEARTKGRPTSGWRVPPVWGALAAAAVLVIAVGLGIWFLAARQPAGVPATAPEQARQDAPADPVELANSVETELRLAEQHYENAIAGLERLARDRQQVLDPEVAETLHRNLQVIDTAIGESRAALQAQPANEPARQSLFEAFRTKIALLEDTIALLNELRQSQQGMPEASAKNSESL